MAHSDQPPKLRVLKKISALCCPVLYPTSKPQVVIVAEERVQKSEEKLSEVSHSVEASQKQLSEPWLLDQDKYIYIYILHALSLAGLGVHESSLREPMDATFWLKEMSQNSIHFVFLNLVVLSRFWLTKG